jgi:hypothetical protein
MNRSDAIESGNVNLNDQVIMRSSSQTQAIKVTDFNYIKILGKGSFGKVNKNKSKIIFFNQKFSFRLFLLNGKDCQMNYMQ